MALFRPQPVGPPPPYLLGPPTPNASQLALTSRPRSASASSAATTVKDIVLAIQKVQEKHFSIDEHLDKEDLCAILRTALHEPEDVGLIRLLEIEKPEWPEAIKTLQRRLEEIRSSPVPEGEDTIHREFVESGIDCLRRMSGEDTTVPSWTITKYEVGFLSSSFRRWETVN